MSAKLKKKGTGWMWLILLLSSCALAQDADRAATTAAAETAACAALPAGQQQACMEATETRLPEDVAREQAYQQAARAYHLRLADTLARSGQPRELAFAATLRSMAQWTSQMPNGAGSDVLSQALPRDPQAAAWRRAAADRAGSDVIANALLMQGDGTAADARLRHAAAARWAAAEPDNLAPLFYGEAGVEAVLAAAAQRQRFDLRGYDQMRWMMEALAKDPPRAGETAALAGGRAMSIEEDNAMRAVGIWSAAAMPAFLPISEACRGPALDTSPSRRTDCRRLARRMIDASDTALGESIGLGLLARTAGNEAERAEADELRRRFDWRMLEWGRVSQQLPNDGATDFVRLLRDPTIRSESDLMARQLRDAGVALDPPAGWQSPRRE